MLVVSLSLALALLVTPVAAAAQQPPTAPRVGFLLTSTPESTAQYLEAFRQGLRELEYVDGKNIAIDHRWAGNVLERLDGFAAELVRMKVAVIVTQGTPAARAAGKATTTIPIVIAVGEPIGTRLVKSLNRPGGNITGLTVDPGELNAKRLQLLREISPNASRLAVIVDATATNVKQMEAAARVLGLPLQVLTVRGPSEFERAFAAASEARADAMLVSPSPLLSFHRKALVDLAAKHRLPAMYGNRESVETGGLMSYGPSYPALFRRAAAYVDKLLKGARPADLPIEQPAKFELVINLKTANALGLTIPQSVSLRADELIQ